MASSTEQTGIYHCTKIAKQNGWIFQEQPIDEVSIDAHMEFTTPALIMG